MRYAWIHGYRDVYAIARSCRLLEVARSGYYEWQRRQQCPSGRMRENTRLLAELESRHRRHRQCYGSPRMTADLRAAGWAVNRKRIARLMRCAGIRARGRCRRRYPTQSTHSYPLAPNHVAQQFAVGAPNRVWVTDITYVATDEGWVYVALVMDLFSRKFVGWAVENWVDRRLTLAALRMALSQRQPQAALLHHSDRGVQYAATEYRAVLESHGITLSMSRKGNCYDNAPMESANGTIKTERVYPQRYATRAQAKADLIAYFGYYNTERRHSALGYRNPAEFERQWWSRQHPAEAPPSRNKGDTEVGIEGRSPLIGQI